MRDYYDFDEDESVDFADEKEFAKMKAETFENRPRYGTLEDAFDYDEEYVNYLLNLEDLGENEAAKAMIACLHERAVCQLVDLNEISCSWDEFLQARLGEKEYNKLMGQWLQMRGNEFMQKVGLEDEMRPASIYYFNPQADEEDDDE